MDNSKASLSTCEALTILHNEIDQVLHQFKQTQKKRRSKSWIRDSLGRTSHYTTINWISLCLLIWSSTSLILAYFIGDYSKSKLIESLIIVCFTTVSAVLVLYDNRTRHNETPKRVQRILDEIQGVLQSNNWSSSTYPSLFMPTSPCITLQWTYRDGKLINLPYSLLVKGDLILVRPGQSVPGYCEAVDKNTEHPILHAKDVYAPQIHLKTSSTTAQIRKPLPGTKYILLETPYLINLRLMLEQALDRPSSHLNHQLHILLVEMVQSFILPVAFVVFYALSALKYLHLKFDNDIALFLLYPTNGILPLLPMIFPIVWNLANYVGLARLHAIFYASKIVQGAQMFSLEEEADNTIVEHIRFKYKWISIIRNFFAILRGDPEILARTTNILHVLGSVTALGCVDKKGVLSWPNPTAEKVCFLHNKGESTSSSVINDEDVTDFHDDSNLQDHSNSATIEVLDLTHDHHDPVRLQFDDHNWQKHLSSLKPLGLAILLNTCNPATELDYADFCSHITCESINSETLVPVSNRRCLCELAKIIGFVDDAQKVFSLEQKLCTFRHLQAEAVRRDNKYARSLQMANSKLKVPFPHMFAVVTRETTSGAIQLMTEGTADIVLDSCLDYWDGKDLCTLSVTDRKRLLDFYQRASLTAYCTAFSYRPLNRMPKHDQTTQYLELASDYKHLLQLGARRSPTPVSLFYSTDSLLHGYETTSSPERENGADACHQLQCNQVFIGMVSMQYQALTDMVHLIEQLERACIRFVHFSKENELRSRVFSEKMGLESGWNCHISLLSDKNRGGNAKSNSMVNVQQLQRQRQELDHVNLSNLENLKTMSFSAPSSINVDQSTVRFDEDTKRHRDSCDETSTGSRHASHDWQSMSCLTDSTDQSAPLIFDMSNRAKLPRGIDKIRPHIELMDNVPLLVSLFTDCTPQATREMLHIMQDYGEIVCILGSAANFDNAGIFMQADASVAVEPLYPQVCQKRPVYRQCRGPSPIDLARRLNGLPCSLCIQREDPINLYHLIMESRHFVTSIWNAVQFWVCCCATVTGVQVACSVSLMPSPLSTGQVLWLISVVIPCLSAALIALPVDAEVMKRPLGKNDLSFSWNIFFFILWCYGLKFLPTIVSVLITFWGILTSHCPKLCEFRNCTCMFEHTPIVGDVDKTIGWVDEDWTLNSARLLVLMLIVAHFVAISIGFVHRSHLTWQKLPTTNRLWIVTVLIFLIIQILYTIISYHIHTSKEIEFDLPGWVTTFGSLSPIFAFLINELVKYEEISINTRFLKRARLDFGTKLGMNSPF